MKKYLIIFSLFFSNSISAKECSFLWKVSSSGIYLGKSTDTIYFKDKETVVESFILPSKVAKFFGAPEFHRITNLDKNLSFKFNFEERLKQNNILEWKKEGSELIRYQNNEKKDNFPIENTITLDNNIIPYISLIYPNIDKKTNFNILTKNKVFYLPIEFNSNEIYLSYEKTSIKIKIDSESYPISLIVNDGKTIFDVILEEKKCSKT